MITTKLPEVELNVLKARDRFFSTAAAVELRLAPSHLVGDAATVARSGLSRLGHRLARKARQRPAAAAATAAGLAALLMRRTLFRMVRQTLG